MIRKLRKHILVAFWVGASWRKRAGSLMTPSFLAWVDNNDNIKLQNIFSVWLTLISRLLSFTVSIKWWYDTTNMFVVALTSCKWNQAPNRLKTENQSGWTYVSKISEYTFFPKNYLIKKTCFILTCRKPGRTWSLGW